MSDVTTASHAPRGFDQPNIGIDMRSDPAKNVPPSRSYSPYTPYGENQKPASPFVARANSGMTSSRFAFIARIFSRLTVSVSPSADGARSTVSATTRPSPSVQFSVAVAATSSQMPIVRSLRAFSLFVA